ncbi:hypothetical protein CLAIMM_01231 [Cladophialophora immunda]|nr:hypothetical protein CLAIMM_01231 [Cladophialophora immunda]
MVIGKVQFGVVKYIYYIYPELCFIPYPTLEYLTAHSQKPVRAHGGPDQAPKQSDIPASQLGHLFCKCSALSRLGVRSR